MNDKQAVTGKENGGGKQNPDVQKNDGERSLNKMAIVLAVILAIGILLALIFG